jgi:hypothetical protein
MKTDHFLMNCLITLDYELFFGAHTGTVEQCMITPTNKLLEILNPLGIKATFFVDIGLLVRADELNVFQPQAKKVAEHIQSLAHQGHDIQLHIHPHWERAEFSHGQWQFDLDYYKLSDFPVQIAAQIVLKYCAKLNHLINSKAIAFRAGGWCIQPFSHFGEALYEAGIRVDSTIYHNGYDSTPLKGFDFRAGPTAPSWRFTSDPLVPEPEGLFTELPISALKMGPLFYWRFALAKKTGGEQHKSFGDGQAVSMSKKNMLRLLTRRSNTVASVDGYKASLLNRCRANVLKTAGEQGNLLLIGHPKALSPYSLARLADYLAANRQDNYLTINDWYMKHNE